MEIEKIAHFIIGDYIGYKNDILETITQSKKMQAFQYLINNNYIIMKEDCVCTVTDKGEEFYENFSLD